MFFALSWFRLEKGKERKEKEAVRTAASIASALACSESSRVNILEVNITEWQKSMLIRWMRGIRGKR